MERVGTWHRPCYCLQFWISLGRRNHANDVSWKWKWTKPNEIKDRLREIVIGVHGRTPSFGIFIPKPTTAIFDRRANSSVRTDPHHTTHLYINYNIFQVMLLITHIFRCRFARCPRVLIVFFLLLYPAVGSHLNDSVLLCEFHDVRPFFHFIPLRKKCRIFLILLFRVYDYSKHFAEVLLLNLNV